MKIIHDGVYYWRTKPIKLHNERVNGAYLCAANIVSKALAGRRREKVRYESDSGCFSR